MESSSTTGPQRQILLGPAIAVVFAGALMLGACSSSPASSSSPATSAATPASRGRPLASGLVSSMSRSSIVVQNARTGSPVTVDWSSSTTFDQTVTASASELAVGDCVEVLGTSGSSGSASARTVSISMPTSAGCTRSGGFSGRPPGGGGAGGFGGGGFGGGGLPFTSAFGTTTSIGNGSLTVKGTSSSGSTTTTFSYDSTTSFTKVQSAKASSVTSGQCATAYGSSSSSGSVAASTITLRPPGPNGCSGFGGGGGGGGFGGSSSPA